MTKFEYLRERSGRYDLASGTYCIIPVTYKPNSEAEYMLRIATEKPAESGFVRSNLTSLLPLPCSVKSSNQMFHKTVHFCLRYG